MDSFAKYYTLALRQLTRRPRSKKEIHDYLIGKKATEEIFEQVMEKLHEMKFQDDTAFASWWIEQRSKVRAKSDRIIALELAQKGVAKEIVQRLLSDSTEEKVSDFDKAKQIALKKVKSLQALSRYEQYQKLGAFLSRKGFDFEVCKRVIDDVLERDYNRQ